MWQAVDVGIWIRRSVSRLVRIIENVDITQDVAWWTKSPDISLLNTGLCYNNVMMQKAIRVIGTAIMRARGEGMSNRRVWSSVLRELPKIMSGRTLEFIVLPNILNFFLVCLQLAAGYGFPILLVYVYLYDCRSLAVSRIYKSNVLSSTASYFPETLQLLGWRSKSLGVSGREVLLPEHLRQNGLHDLAASLGLRACWCL